MRPLPLGMQLRAYHKFALLSLCAPAYLAAQATRCVRPAGTGEVFTTVDYSSASSGFDNSRHRESFSDDGRYTKLELNPYIEYGLTNRLTGVANLFFASATYRDNTSSNTTTGLESPEFALRYDLSSLHGLGSLVCGIQVDVKAPVRTPGNPALGLPQTDVEARLISLHTFTRAPNEYGYFDAEFAYRYRAGDPADEIHVDASLGIPVTTSLQFLAQAYTTTGMRNYNHITAAVDPNAASDYDLYKAVLSLVKSLTPRVRLQAGAFANVLGRNTGAGGGGLLSLWTKF